MAQTNADRLFLAEVTNRTMPTNNVTGMLRTMTRPTIAKRE